MAFIYKVNQNLASWTAALFSMHADMITQGWRVMGSGDGLAAFENTGQTAGSSGTGTGGGFHVITSAGSGAGGMGNQSLNSGASWIRLRAPADALNPNLEYLWWLTFRATMSLNKYRLMVSTNGTGFNTGGSALTAPTATDGIALAGAQVLQNDFRDTDHWVPSGQQSHTHWAVGDKDEEYGFVMHNWRVTGAEAWGVWGMQPLMMINGGSNPPTTEDPDPNIHFCSHDDSNGNSFNFFDAAGAEQMMYSNASPNPRLEANTSVGVERGAFAFYGKGESPAHANTGMYSVAMQQPFTFNGGVADHLFDATNGLDVDPISGHQPHLGNLLWARGEATAGATFWKGMSLGNILMLTRHDGTTPVVDENPAMSEARLTRSGISVPWPQGTAFVMATEA